MSRHSIADFDPSQDIIVGWDWRSRTFFCQVRDLPSPSVDYTTTNSPGSLIFQIGTHYDEIQDLEDLRQSNGYAAAQAAIAPYAVLPENIVQELQSDLASAILPRPLPTQSSGE